MVCTCTHTSLLSLANTDPCLWKFGKYMFGLECIKEEIISNICVTFVA